MDSITKRYGLANFDDFSITGFLVPTGHYAQEIGLIDLFKEHLKIDMKTVHHTPVEKVIELFVSMIAGCPDVKTVNNRLVPDRLAAAAWCQKQFADQSQVSEVIHRITPENLLQLEEIFHKLLSQQGLARRHPVSEWLVVDVDMTGLPVSPTSKTYEGATFGFMQKETGKGYKLTCAYTGGELGEVLGGLFDSGTAHCATKLIDLLLLVEKRVGSPPRSLHKYRASIEQSLTEAGNLERRSQRRREEARRARKSQRQAVLEGRSHKLDTRAQLLREKVTDSLQIADSFDTLRSSNPYRAILIRGDAGFGSIDKIMLLLDLGYDFLLKGYSPHTARNLAQGIAENEWIPFNGATSVAELGAIRLPECRYAVRTVLGRSKTPRCKSYQYFHLVATIPEKVKSPIALLRFYNARQTIEAFIKTGKNVLNLKHFRVRNFYGIEFTLMLGLLAHNFMSWARRDIFAGTPLARMGIREFVEQAMRVPARAEFLGMDTFITVFPETSLYAQALVQAIERKSSAQLALPFTEPEKNKRVISFS
ncbi:transposase [Dehalococcoidia bacterium]|nr:transposase [Dehalococcoidia bacterium]